MQITVSQSQITNLMTLYIHYSNHFKNNHVRVKLEAYRSYVHNHFPYHKHVRVKLEA